MRMKFQKSRLDRDFHILHLVVHKDATIVVLEHIVKLLKAEERER